MKRDIIVTKDGSHTIVIPDAAVTYHSRHGAIRESMHVFIEAGLSYMINQRTNKPFNHSANQPINLFEMGFGTGLNALLTAIEAEKHKIKIDYTAIEQFPLEMNERVLLNYGSLLHQEPLFQFLHETPWNTPVPVTNHFTLTKIQDSLINIINQSTHQPFHLIYYDAFAPSAQPELWTVAIFQKLHDILAPGGILVTYCAKGYVRRALLAAGFKVEKLPGPPGKREMLRAVRISNKEYGMGKWV